MNTLKNWRRKEERREGKRIGEAKRIDVEKVEIEIESIRIIMREN